MKILLRVPIWVPIRVPRWVTKHFPAAVLWFDRIRLDVEKFSHFFSPRVQNLSWYFWSKQKTVTNFHDKNYIEDFLGSVGVGRGHVGGPGSVKTMWKVFKSAQAQRNPLMQKSSKAKIAWGRGGVSSIWPRKPIKLKTKLEKTEKSETIDLYLDLQQSHVTLEIPLSVKFLIREKKRNTS